MTENQIETHRVAGDITLILKNGSEEKRASLMRVIRYLNPYEAERIQKWIDAGMPEDVDKTT